MKLTMTIEFYAPKDEGVPVLMEVVGWLQNEKGFGVTGAQIDSAGKPSLFEPGPHECVPFRGAGKPEELGRCVVCGKLPSLTSGQHYRILRRYLSEMSLYDVDRLLKAKKDCARAGMELDHRAQIEANDALGQVVLSAVSRMNVSGLACVDRILGRQLA